MLEQLDHIELDQIPVRTFRDGRQAMNWPTGRAPRYGGVYCFWWTRGAKDFVDSIQHDELHYAGPANVGNLVYRVRLEALLERNGRLPLYVGKAHRSIANRVGLHLKLSTNRTVPMGSVDGPAPRMTTSCQVRDRLDRLFPNERDTRPVALVHLQVSYVAVPDFAERFFLEDLAIGVFRPIFNIDSER